MKHQLPPTPHRPSIEPDHCSPAWGIRKGADEAERKRSMDGLGGVDLPRARDSGGKHTHTHSHTGYFDDVGFGIYLLTLAGGKHLNRRIDK